MGAATWKQLVETAARELQSIGKALAPDKKPKGRDMRPIASLVCALATIALTAGMIRQAVAGNLPVALICGLFALVNAFLAGATSDTMREEK